MKPTQWTICWNTCVHTSRCINVNFALNISDIVYKIYLPWTSELKRIVEFKSRKHRKRNKILLDQIYNTLGIARTFQSDTLMSAPSPWADYLIYQITNACFLKSASHDCFEVHNQIMHPWCLPNIGSFLILLTSFSLA